MAKFGQTRFRIKSKILLLDATTISLCLSLFDWAVFRKKKGAIKLHTLLDFDGCLPVYVHMTDGKVHVSMPAKQIVLPKDAVVVADRAYVDFPTLFNWDSSGSYFVVRLKTSIKFNRLEEKSLPEQRHQHILVDEYIELSEEKTKAKYPRKLRRVVVWDEQNNQTIELITNQMFWTANTISELYKARREIEVFFKEIKQLLKIKSQLNCLAAGHPGITANLPSRLNFSNTILLDKLIYLSSVHHDIFPCYKLALFKKHHRSGNILRCYKLLLFFLPDEFWCFSCASDCTSKPGYKLAKRLLAEVEN